ncbi:hypothetical protein VitviT2T_025728 [Vitis vinifera]|uniref:CCHC-type domain-containing protein n=1 Tax=Vitis vinifera TaxID=29760 RepID=A0ABY9DJR7_VITVI|nr:hypothetical protein VitviT2T_025728 [Vitis vinifera]
MAANWRPGMGISIQEIYPQRFLFQFSHEADIRRIQESGPWAYDNYPLIFERVAQGDNLDKVDLNELAMWIQLHDLPAGWWSDSIAQNIGSCLGEFLESDPNNYLGAKKDYMRIRIKFDVLKPLKKMINLKKPKGEGMIQVTIRYERLPTYCFQCGMLGHGEKFCRLNYATEKGVSVRNYGPELRALPRRAAQLRIGEKWLKAAPVMLTIEDGKAKISPPSGDDMDCGGNKENSNVGSDGEQKGAITIRGPHEDGNGKKVEPPSAPQTTKFTAGQIVNKLPESVFFEEVDVTGVEPKHKRVGLTQEAHSTNDPMEGDFSTTDDHHPKNLELAGSTGSYGVNCRGHSAGLGLIWRCKDKVTILGSHDRYIDATVTLENQRMFRLTGFYGDFNELMHRSKKRGNHPHPGSLIEAFRQAVTDCGLSDLGYVGYAYTWERGRGTTRWVEERLDRALVSADWKHLFNQSRLIHLSVSTFDHLPVLLELRKFVPRQSLRCFKYENSWSLEPHCAEVVRQSWGSNGDSDVMSKLVRCSKDLEDWGKRLRLKWKSRIKELKNQIEVLKWAGASGDVALLNHDEYELNIVLRQEEEYWKQRAKLFWLKPGDSNSRAFHLAASKRRSRNAIANLRGEDSQMYGMDNSAKQIVVDYFEQLFRSGGCDISDVQSLITPVISVEQNESLTRPFAVEEVKDALFTMHSDKSPGDDGFSPGFYQRHWEIVGENVVNACIEWLNDGMFPDSLNRTNIVLIPKKSEVISMTDLRPISLCNVVFKIASKLLANRLKKVLDGVVSEAQNAFVPGRSITDSILIAHEVLHFLKRKREGRIGYAALKIDISKAYDKLEWNYLFAVLEAMGFSLKWLEWMRMVVALLKQGERCGVLHGCSVARGASTVSHLFFADDSYLFFKATESESWSLKQILLRYQNLSGQEINLNKSALTFSRNTDDVVKRGICSILQVEEQADPGIYLGMPTVVGKNKRQLFEFVRRKVWNRIQNWNGSRLSRAGKEICLKTVAQSIPTYVIQLLLLPKDLCRDIESDEWLLLGF